MSHFSQAIRVGQLDVAEFRHPLFPGVIVATTVCDLGHNTAFVLNASDVQLDMVRAEWTGVAHWFAGTEYNNVRELP
jgi:hypothetical protein